MLLLLCRMSALGGEPTFSDLSGSLLTGVATKHAGTHDQIGTSSQFARLRGLGAKRIAAMAAVNAKFPNPKERTPTILVVDDEPLIRMTVSDYLQECGFKVFEASNADEAQQMIQSSALVLDLVFSDVKMPGTKDGFALAQWIRTHRPEIRVVLASGDSSKIQNAHDLCADEPFFSKPYDLKLLVTKIRQLLSMDDSDRRS